MAISRRFFLKSGYAATLSALSPGLLRLAIPTAAAAGSGDYRAAVCIYLDGGNDGSNCFVPLDDVGYQGYTTSRGELALPADSLLPVQPLGSSTAYGFHSQLPGLRNLFTQGKLAVLANVGTLKRPITRADYLARTSPIPQRLFSHSDQSKQWQVSQGNELTGNSPGWGGQMADSLLAYNSAALYPSVTSMAGSRLYCEGRVTRPSAVNPYNTGGLSGFNGSSTSVLRRQSMQQIIDTLSGHALVDSAASGSRRMLDEITVLNNAMNALPSLQTVFPDTSIGKQFRQVARMIQARDSLGMSRQIFFVSLGGFDTHADQLASQAGLLARLDAAMASFYQATEELAVASQVTSFTLSEFGRTLLPANGGSDHGWGNHHFIMGGAVNGGDVYGEFPSLVLSGSDDASDKGRFIPTTSVDQYAATIANWLGVGTQDLADLFPNLINFPNPLLRFI